ncbi:desiccation-related protein PCC13-62-like [Durio zibethinus]|uniref:Desiccation-related protein PCC13-62-like n=1 Tax=Durio zibethinus TaxID=66656 RepID=A0A6P6A843_DURZI|nr:desiccation-related protein PCC13-62-like [Durio zibethinus]
MQILYSILSSSYLFFFPQFPQIIRYGASYEYEIDLAKPGGLMKLKLSGKDRRQYHIALGAVLFLKPCLSGESHNGNQDNGHLVTPLNQTPPNPPPGSVTNKISIDQATPFATKSTHTINTMSPTLSSPAIVVISFLVFFLLPSAYSSDFLSDYKRSSVPKFDVNLLEFPLNLEYLEAEFFLYGALGHGLDKVAPYLAQGGPSPIGAKKANLDALTKDVVLQFAYQEVGHLKAIKKTVKGFPRPQLDLSASSFAKVIDHAFGKPLVPPFDPYANSINYLIASYLIPYVGLTGYVGANPKLQGAVSKRLVAGLLGVESGQDAVIRGLLYEKALVKVSPYQTSVAEFTGRISELRNRLGHAGRKDEGLIVPRTWGAEGKVIGNVLAGDQFSVAFDRSPEEILRIVYGSGNESIPGGFYPKGANGHIARSHLHH